MGSSTNAAAQGDLHRIHVTCGRCGVTNRVAQARMHEHPVCGQCGRALFDGHPVELDEAGFARLLRGTELPVVVDFWAPWCGPCRAMAPQLERAAQLLEPEFRLVKVNTEQAPAVAQSFGVRSIPTLVMLAGGREIARQVGATDAEALVRWARTRAAAAGLHVGG